MKLIFMGTPQIAVPCLEVLHARHEILLAVTQPDKPLRRGHKMQTMPSPVKARALELGIPVAQPERARDETFVEELRALRPEAIAVVAYGQILPAAILDLPSQNHPHGVSLNVHFSLLARWRGAAPVQYAIWRGDAQSGVTVQQMALQLDAGDILLQRAVAIEENESSGQLLQRLTPIGAQMLIETLDLLQENRITRTPQNPEDVTLAPQIQKEWGQIDWKSSAIEIHNMIRAFDPWPSAWTHWRGEALKIWSARVDAENDKADGGTISVDGLTIRVATGAGMLRLESVQPSGKARMNALDWARGARLESGARFEFVADDSPPE